MNQGTERHRRLLQGQVQGSFMLSDTDQSLGFSGIGVGEGKIKDA